MPVTVGDDPTIAEHSSHRRPPRNNQPTSDPQIPSSSIVPSTHCKPTISSLLLSTLSPTTDTPTTTATTTKKKNRKNITSGGSFRGLGCAASSQVSVPAVIRSSADWEAKKVRKKKMKNKAPIQDVAMASNNPSSSSASASVVVVPDVWCGPGITDDSVVVSTRRPVSGRAKVDGDKMNQRERSSNSTRRMVRPEPASSLDSDYSFGMTHPGLDVFGARYHRHVRHHSPDGLEEILMLQNSLLLGGRSDGFDRYRDWRLDVDNMSYEELLELGDRIGQVNTGLKEDEIVHCLSKTKLLDNLFSQVPTEMERKCSICQEDYELDDEMGKLECGHFYHFHCIKQWLVRKKICPICKTAAAAQQ